jgi:hypothetical protein
MDRSVTQGIDMPYPFELNDSPQMRVRHQMPKQFDHMRQPYRLRPLRPLRHASGRHAGHICSPLSSLSAVVCYRLKGGRHQYWGIYLFWFLR